MKYKIYLFKLVVVVISKGDRSENKTRQKTPCKLNIVKARYRNTRRLHFHPEAAENIIKMQFHEFRFLCLSYSCTAKHFLPAPEYGGNNSFPFQHFHYWEEEEKPSLKPVAKVATVHSVPCNSSNIPHAVLLPVAGYSALPENFEWIFQYCCDSVLQQGYEILATDPYHPVFHTRSLYEDSSPGMSFRNVLSEALVIKDTTNMTLPLFSSRKGSTKNRPSGSLQE